jgi:hypothetical protein
VQADYFLAVERLLAAADAARDARNRLLGTPRIPVALSRDEPQRPEAQR